MKTVNLTEKTVLLDIVFHRPGMTRPLGTDGVEMDADKAWVNFRKTILKNDNYQLACKTASKCMKYVHQHTLPNRIFRRGVHLVPLTTLQGILDKLDQAEKDYLGYAETFFTEYEKSKEEAKIRLVTKYREADYPSTSFLRRAFWVERQLFELGVPDGGKVGTLISDEAQKQAKAKWQEAADDVSYALREQFRDLVAYLTERLEPATDGTKKIFKEASLKKVLDWIELFQSRNVLNDEQMEQLTSQAKDLLKGRAAKGLRTDPTLRTSMVEEMTKIKTALDKALENAPARRIVFDD